MTIDDGSYRGYYQLGRDPKEMSWSRSSDAVLELVTDGLVLGEDPEGAPVRREGPSHHRRPLLCDQPGGGTQPRVAVEVFGHHRRPDRGRRVASVAVGMRRSGDSLSALGDMGLGWVLALAAIFLIFVGGMGYAATRKWAVMHLTADSGQRVAAAVQLRKIPPADVASAITARRSRGGDPSPGTASP